MMMTTKLLLGLLLAQSTLLSVSGFVSESHKRNLDSPCSQDSDCTTSNSQCREGTCQCLPNFVKYNSTATDCANKEEQGILSCLKVAEKVGDECNVDLQCKSGTLGALSYCTDDKTCSCTPSATHPNSNPNVCAELRDNLNEACEFDEQCRVLNSHCDQTSKKCACTRGRVPSPDEPNKCLLLAVRLNGSCHDHDIQCSQLENSNCNRDKPGEEVCICSNSVLFVEDPEGKGCLPRFYEPEDLIYKECKISEQCGMEGSSCEIVGSTGRKGCTCRAEYYVESKGKCLKIQREVGAPCSENTQCRGLGAATALCNEEGKCQCRDQYLYHHNLCHRISDMGDECQFDEQCSAKNANYTCMMDPKSSTKSSCQCKSGYAQDLSFRRCYPIRKFGDSCSVPSECQASIADSTCLDKKCTCLNAVLSSDGKRCLPSDRSVGLTCEETKQCKSSKTSNGEIGAVCDRASNKCQCVDGWESNEFGECIKKNSSDGIALNGNYKYNLFMLLITLISLKFCNFSVI